MDLRGIGASSVRADRAYDFGYDTLVSDAFAGVAALRAFAQVPEVVVLGHSLGGHLALLMLARQTASEPLARVALVAAGSPFYASYRNPVAKGVILTIAQTAKIATRALGYFPGKQIGFGGREARTVMREWSSLARKNAFDIHGWTGELPPEAALARVRARVLAIEIERDAFSPRRSIDALLSKVPRAEVTRALQQGRGGNGRAVHHNWARSPKRVVERFCAWLQEAPGALASPAA
jgi:predicted alpha/beta hydrolase